ncbi:hypothetical protein P4S55_17835 [Shewanella sp. PP-Sp27a-2]
MKKLLSIFGLIAVLIAAAIGGGIGKEAGKAAFFLQSRLRNRLKLNYTRASTRRLNYPTSADQLW